MKAKLLKQIRKRFEIKIIDRQYIYFDKVKKVYGSNVFFNFFIIDIGSILNRYFEFRDFLIKRIEKKEQINLKHKFGINFNDQ